jgi:MFS family permease
MQSEVARDSSARSSYEGARLALLGVLALLMLLPVTMPVTVLRALVHERFGVSELLTSLFMSINMVGAVLAAAPAGALADRFGRRRDWIVAALLADATLLLALTLPVSFPVFLFLRFLEGCAHIVALSLLLSLAAAASSEARRGRVMGLVGAGITLGVAIGAPLGGVIGRSDPLLPLQVGGAIVAAAALLARLGLVEVGGGEARPSMATILRTLRANPLLGAPLAYSFVDRFTVGFYTTTFSLYLSRVHELPAPRIGALIAIFMLPFALLSYPFGRLAERHSRVAMVAGGTFVYGVGTATLAFWPVGALYGLMGFLGIVSAVMFVPSLVLATDVAPREIRGSVLGAFNAAGSLGFIAGPLAGGFVSQTVAHRASWEAGYQAAFAVAGLSAIACVLITLPFLLRLVRLGRTR